MPEQVLAEPQTKSVPEAVMGYTKNIPLVAFPELVKVSLILPIYNEGAILFDNVRNIMKTLDSLGLTYEILLCDDNSNDGTKDAAERASSEDVFHLRFSRRIGKGATIKNALSVTRGEVIVILDADIPVSQKEIAEAISLMNNGGQFVVGVRRARPYTRTRRKILSVGFNTLMNLLFRTGIRDHQCGFKLIHRNVADRLFPIVGSDYFTFDAELIVRARSLRIPITQFEIDWLEKRNGQDSNLPVLGTTLAMLVDLLVLRTVPARSQGLLGIRRINEGFFIDPATGELVPSRVSMRGSENSNLVKILRRLYINLSNLP